MNIATWLTRAAAATPDRPAVVHGECSRTYSELADRVARLATALRDSGLVEGDRVGILQRNGIAILESLLACFHAGLVAVPINARCTPREVAQIAEDAEPGAWIVTEEYENHLPADRSVLVVSTRPDAEASLDAVIASAESFAPVAVDPTAPAWLFYTSGTTGRMKGATLTHRNLLAMTNAFLADVDPLPAESVMLHCAPLTHGSGLYALPALARGATQLITSSTSYSPAEVLDLIESASVTHIAFLAPTMVNRLVAEQQERPRDTSSLANVVYGGAPMYTADITRAVAAFGPVFSQIFGQAEAPVTIATATRARVAAAVESGDEVLGWVGSPYACVELALRTSTDEIVRSGEGEILVRGDVVMAGYWNAPEATASTLRDGWLHTGDIGRIDETGEVYLLDRSKDVIITGGANVYPREVEEVLIQHPGVLEVSVVGAPDDEWGERVVAVAVARPGHDVAELEPQLIALCREHISGYKIPKQFAWRDELPKSAYGKILKRELRNTFWRHVDRTI